jgi:hypothetical protein
MSAVAPVGAKIALIVPRLGSPHDGEIIASARAIERTLKGAGLDWHDMAAALAETDQHVRNEAVAPIWSELDLARRWGWIRLLIDQTRLTAWERSFAASIADRLVIQPFGRLSMKQEVVLNRMIFRAFQSGARPRSPLTLAALSAIGSSKSWQIAICRP